MRKSLLLKLGVATALAASLPALAWSTDQQGGGQQGRPGSGSMSHGSMQRDRLHDQDRTYDRDRLRDRDRDRDRDTIYGSQLMTRSERNAYRTKMRSLKTAQEREAFRAQHHEQMQERAKQRGVKLPDSPPQAGQRGGMGPGQNGSPGTMQQQQTEQRTRTQTQQEQRERTTAGDDGNDGN